MSFHPSIMRCVFLILCLVLLECTPSVRAQELGCYTSGSVAGIVIATVVVTLVMGGLAAAFIWYLWKQRKIGYGDNKSMEKPIVCPPMSPDKQMIARESNDYAFDNPYFKDDETDRANPDAAEKGESGFRKDNGDISAPVQNAKASNGTTGNHPHKKSRPFSSLPFHAVFHPSGKKQQRATTMDDTYISKHLERITVPLRGHDFTGLGFNICGNMRDGIFVKDVLHRGPASESGKIKAGDRIVGVTVSFAAMVYEDALTILSYASPYDVRLEIEKAPATLSGPHLPSSSPRRIGTSTSFRNNGQRRLFHPLYRSQSIDDLTQIGKDGFGTLDTSGSQRDSSSSATPKRSQSVEASNGGLKARPHIILKPEETKSSSSKGSRKSSTSSCESTAKAVTPTEKCQPVLNEEITCTKKETKSARFRAEQVNVKAEAPSLKAVPPAKPARDSSHEDKQVPLNDISEKMAEEKSSDDVPTKPETENLTLPDSESDAEKPTAPPRKASTPKRRAPAPPPVAKTETSAVVHRADELQQESQASAAKASTDENSEVPPPPPISELPPAADEHSVPVLSNGSFTITQELLMASGELPVFSSTEKIADPSLGSSDTSSLASADHSSTKMEKDDQNASPGKRKASSLGDLTKLEHGAHKKTSISSALLERAVSLDLQQSLPGENLTKQKKILRAPAFEDDYIEDREDLTEINGQGLKRWDDGLDKVFAKLPNGEVSSNQDVSNGEDDVSSDVVDIKASNSELNGIDKLETELIIESSSEKSAADLENDFLFELPPLSLHDPETLITSTPVKKVIAVTNLPDDDDDDDDDIIKDVPYLASSIHQNAEEPSTVNQNIEEPSTANQKIEETSTVNQKVEETSTKFTAKTNNSSTTVFSPVTISIPVIKPDLTHFEKLPSPPPASTHPALETNWKVNKIVMSDVDGGKPSLERISVQSLYKPIFTSKEINIADESISPEKMVNGGNESDASEHYSTAQENTSTSSVETSSLSVTLSTPFAKEVAKTPNTIAGFAKTLIIPGPNEVENLLSLAAEPITPPPSLESPGLPIENE